jgi:hypothetical protein
MSIGLTKAMNGYTVPASAGVALSSSRDTNPYNTVCYVWDGVDASGRQANKFSFATRSGGCNSANDQANIETLHRPNYIEWLNGGGSGIQGNLDAGMNQVTAFSGLSSTNPMSLPGAVLPTDDNNVAAIVSGQLPEGFMDLAARERMIHSNARFVEGMQHESMNKPNAYLLADKLKRSSEHMQRDSMRHKEGMQCENMSCGEGMRRENTRLKERMQHENMMMLEERQTKPNAYLLADRLKRSQEAMVANRAYSRVARAAGQYEGFDVAESNVTAPTVTAPTVTAPTVTAPTVTAPVQGTTPAAGYTCRPCRTCKPCSFEKQWKIPPRTVCTPDKVYFTSTEAPTPPIVSRK